VYHQILSHALARYRQEWAYALRCGESWGAELIALRSDDQEVATSGEKGWLIGTLARITEGDRRLIELLFWEGWTESEVASRLGISQQAVSKRKRKALLELHKCFNEADHV
jgi:RNA polymerase sigma factor (sigma-70 family)